MGDASVAGTASRWMVLLPSGTVRAALRGCRIPFGVPHRQRLPMDDRSSDRRRGSPGRAGGTAGSVRDITNP